MKALATCVECFLVQGLLMSMVTQQQHNTIQSHIMLSYRAIIMSKLLFILYQTEKSLQLFNQLHLKYLYRWFCSPQD